MILQVYTVQCCQTSTVESRALQVSTKGPLFNNSPCFSSKKKYFTFSSSVNFIIFTSEFTRTFMSVTHFVDHTPNISSTTNLIYIANKHHGESHVAMLLMNTMQPSPRKKKICNAQTMSWCLFLHCVVLIICIHNAL